jgi:hypothetical protein
MSRKQRQRRSVKRPSDAETLTSSRDGEGTELGEEEEEEDSEDEEDDEPPEMTPEERKVRMS